jgi:hypothetical protein
VENGTCSGGGGFGRLFDKASGAGWLLSVDGSAQSLTFNHSASTQSGMWNAAASSITQAAWHHVVLVYNTSSTGYDPTFYVDGSSVTVTETSAPTGTIDSDGAATLYVGGRATADRGCHGRLDEIRMSVGTRLPGWIATEYANQSSPDSFMTVSAPL